MACPATTIRVRTRCVETGWHGGCERSVPVCSSTQISQIFTALAGICAKVNSCNINGIGDLTACVRAASDNVVWKCGSLGNWILSPKLPATRSR